MEAIGILRPAIVLVGWTGGMLAWLLATRLPALSKAGIEPQQAQDTSRLRDLLPAEAQRVANNYNHLFEQPTLFYALVAMIAILGDVDSLHVQCAWAFTVLRIIHSCVQATVDIVAIRFGVFLLSWIALGIMIVREVMAVF
ncbi:MAG: hypothetical protein CL933_14905 [Deltaproteobacteria bacterium]|nr:hypothetical protein [Deltaproteobacteria bacterium]